MNFSDELALRINKAEEIIYSYLPKEEGRQLTLLQAMNYGVKVGGKRLRPILILETLRLFQGDDKDAFPFMAAMEFIHTYSLIHDDLPAMDDAPLRRGKESVHKKYGEAMGVLAGDGLLNLASETVLKDTCKLTSLEKKSKYIEAASVLFNKSGIYGMAGGQSVDVEEDGRPLDVETINFIYALKTGALIEASMIIGAILGNANALELEKIEKAASDIGLAFQIQDDILDIISTEEKLGKPTAADEKNNKTTYVSTYGLEKSKEMVVKLSNEALNIIDSIGKSNEFLKELIINLTTREN